MSTNWKEAVNKVNRDKYVIPAGWDTKEQVAESLECSPDRVNDLLRPGIQSGDIERQTFSVWNEQRRMTEQVVCYRVLSRTAKTSDDSVRGSVERAVERHPEWDDKRIAKNCRTTMAVVSAIRKEICEE